MSGLRDMCEEWQQSSITATLPVLSVSWSSRADSSTDVMPRKSPSVDSSRSHGTMNCIARPGVARCPSGPSGVARCPSGPSGVARCSSGPSGGTNRPPCPL